VPVKGVLLCALHCSSSQHNQSLVGNATSLVSLMQTLSYGALSSHGLAVLSVLLTRAKDYARIFQ
jgi:hypothetical protein